jgi:hypothetical protein
MTGPGDRSDQWQSGNPQPYNPPPPPPSGYPGSGYSPPADPAAGGYGQQSGGYGQPQYPGQQSQYPAPPQYGVPQHGAYPQPAGSTAPPWTTTKTMGLYSLIIGGVSFLLDFLCGVGVVTALIAGVVGFLAYNRAKKYNEPTGMAVGGMVVSGLAFAFGSLWFIFFGFAMMSGGN